MVGQGMESVVNNLLKFTMDAQSISFKKDT
jgi:hypothetical protein